MLLYPEIMIMIVAPKMFVVCCDNCKVTAAHARQETVSSEKRQKFLLSRLNNQTRSLNNQTRYLNNQTKSLNNQTRAAI